MVLTCMVQANGRMRDCEVLGVTPPNCGFEDAALQSAEGARVDRSGARGVRAQDSGSASPFATVRRIIANLLSAGPDRISQVPDATLDLKPTQA